MTDIDSLYTTIEEHSDVQKIELTYTYFASC